MAAAERRCTECGLLTAAGEPDCAGLRDLLLARDFERPALYFGKHRLAVDSYCVQHTPYVQSAKSFAAHLCGLCVDLERANDLALLDGLQRWLSTNPQLVRPELPVHRGELTIAHVSGIDDPDRLRSGSGGVGAFGLAGLRRAPCARPPMAGDVGRAPRLAGLFFDCPLHLTLREDLHCSRGHKLDSPHDDASFVEGW